MRGLHFFLACLLAIHIIRTASASPQLFAEFQRKFLKFYDVEEYQQRYQIFLQNLEEIDHLNRQASRRSDIPDEDRAVFGITQFSDLTAEEFRNTYLKADVHDQETQPPQQQQQQQQLQQRSSLDEESLAEPSARTDAIPVAFDWRNYGRNVVTPVRNQGGCNSAWAFSVSQIVESQWAIAGNPLVALSVQQLVDCVINSRSSCTRGGSRLSALKYVLYGGGLMSEASYPYKAQNGGECRFSASQVVARIIGTSWSNSEGWNPPESEWAAAVARIGPLSVGLTASTLQNYKSGVLTPDVCNNGTEDHDVVITGYGVTPAGLPFWNLKNSWGEGWGEQGYFRIQRGVGACSIYYPQYAIVNPVPNTTPQPSVSRSSSPSPSSAPSPTRTPSSSPSPSHSPTRTPSPSPTKTPSPSPTRTPFPSPTKTPSLSPSSTRTPLPSPSPTRTPLPSPSPSRTSSPSSSPTRSPSPSPSPTKTPSPSPTKTPSPSPSPSKTPSPSPTRTPPPSSSPTRTTSPSPSPTRTPSPSPTKTPSPSPSPATTPYPLPIEPPLPSPSPSPTPQATTTKINFQPAQAPAYGNGYLIDSGLPFGSRGNGLFYGWNTDLTGWTRDRNSALSPDQRADTLIHLTRSNPAGIWEIELPNGNYRVRVISGDPIHIDSVHRLEVEGVIVIDGIPNGTNQWIQSSANVVVNDGRLTLLAATGGVNVKLCELVIEKL